MSKRGTQLAVIGAFALLIVVVAVVISQSESDEGDSGSGGSTDVDQLFAGIPQDGPVLGDPGAPRVIEFVDMQCPFCAEFAQQALPQVIEERVRSGELALELRVLPLLGPDSETGALAAAATVPQDRLWQFSDLFFAQQGAENSGYVTDEFIEGIYAETPGLDAERANQARGSAVAEGLVSANVALAERLGVDGTPTLFLAAGDADPVELALSDLTYSAFEEALSAAGGP